MRHVPAVVEKVLSKNLEPITHKLRVQEESLKSLTEAQQETTAAVTALTQQMASLSSASGGRASSSAGSGGSSHLWAPRVGVCYVGGFPHNSARAFIVECIRRLLSGFAHRDQCTSVWAPDKRWSNGRCQFQSDILVHQFVEYVQQNPQIRTFGVPPRQFELWCAKEKSLGRKNQDRNTTDISKLVHSFLEERFEFDPAKFEVMYLGLQIWYDKLMVAAFDKGTKKWRVCDLSSANVSPADSADLQRRLDAHLT